MGWTNLLWLTVALAQDAGTPPENPQPTPADPAPPDSAGAMSPEDLAAIEAALAADAATVPPPPPKPTIGSVLQSLNPDISFIGDVAFAYFSAEEPLMVGGHDPKANGFHLQQLELSVTKPVDPYFQFDANIVFSLYGVEIEEVYATTMSLPARFQLRVGQFLTRFGRINATHPHSWDFVTQNMTIGRVFGGEGNRGLGLELSWLAPTPWYVEVVGSVTGAAGEATARSFYGPTDLGFKSPLDLQSTIAIKQFFPLSADLSLAWGLSGAFGPNPSGLNNRTDLYGTDVYLKFRPITRESSLMVSLQGEYIYRRRQVPADVWADHNGYAQLATRFAPRWGAAARYEFGSPVTALNGEVVADDLDPEWQRSRNRVGASVTFWPTEFSRVRLQGDVDAAGWKEQPDMAAMVAFEFNVGAHGAHKF